MPSIYQLKPRFQALLRPLVKHLFARGVTANQVTAAALLMSLGIAAVVTLLAEQRLIFLLIPLWSQLRCDALARPLVRAERSRRGDG